MLDLHQATETIRRGYEYWELKRAGRAMPVRADFNPPEMIKFLPNVLFLDVLREPLDFRYRLKGTALEEFMRAPFSMTGRKMSEIEYQRAPSRIWTRCETVVRDGRPLHGSVPYVGRHSEFMEAQDVVMPLGTPEEGVTMLFAVVDFLPRRMGRELVAG